MPNCRIEIVHSAPDTIQIEDCADQAQAEKEARECLHEWADTVELRADDGIKGPVRPVVWRKP